MQVRYYRTELAGKNDDRFHMLADLLAADAGNVSLCTLKPRILHLADCTSPGGYTFLSVIVVWE
jgi:hypothetical protein